MELTSIELSVTAPMLARGNSHQIAVRGLHHLEASKDNRRRVTINIADARYRLTLGDHGSFFRSHQLDGQAQAAFDELHRRLAASPGVTLSAEASVDPGVTPHLPARATPTLPRPGKRGPTKPTGQAAEGKPLVRCEPLLVAGPALDPLPDVIIHADWSHGDSCKRQYARADLRGRRYLAAAPQPLGMTDTWLEGLIEEARRGHSVLAGFDFVIGLPEKFAAAAPGGASNFFELLESLPESFWSVGNDPTRVSWDRPFFPHNSDAWAVLKEVLGASNGDDAAGPLDFLAGAILGSGSVYDDLLRRCERKHGQRARGSSLFVLSAGQVGKASLSGWREVVLPMRSRFREFVHVWPFDGQLRDLVRPGTVTLVETYPAESYLHLGVGNKDKQKQAWRRAAAQVMLTCATARGVEFAPALADQINDGFGSGKTGEDHFDAVAGLLNMALVGLGHDSAYEPTEAVVRDLEGWIFGRQNA